MNSLSGKILMIRLLTGLFALVIIFHILIITGIIPFSIVWGGKLESREDMFRFETVSLTVNTLFMIVLLVKKAYLRKGIKNRWVTGALWLFMALFIVNTVGNLFAESLLEKLVFTPLTLLSAILIFYINRGTNLLTKK